MVFRRVQYPGIGITLSVAADGTGDYQNIQDAINALPASGGTVVLREGTYIINSPIIINKNNVILVGNGKSTKIQTFSGYLGNLSAPISCKGMIQAISQSGIVIKNIYFYGSGFQTIPGLSTAAIYFEKVTHSEIRNCYFENCGGAVIYLRTNCDNNTIESNICTNNKMFGIGIVDNCNSNVVRGNIIIGATDTSYGHGILLTTSGNLNVIANNICNSNSMHGIYLSTSKDNILTGNECKSNIRHGIFLDNNASNNIITGNIVVSNSVGTSNYDGIRIANSTEFGTTDYNVVTSNRCRDNGGYEINISNASCIKNLVVGNICIGTHIGAINDSGTDDLVDNNITE